MGANKTSFKKGELPKVGRQFSKDYQPDKEIWTESEALRLFEDLLKWFDEDNSNIFFDEFLFDNPNLGKRPGVISHNTISYITNKFPSCAELLERAKKKQELRLKKYATFDKINAGMSKFLLSACHGLSEKSEQKQSIEIKRNVIRWGDQEIEI